MDAPIVSQPVLPVVASAFGLVGSICFLTGFGLKLYGYLAECAVRE
jgi:hypothetical protein